MKKKVFIDGSSGTTGLRINERLSQRSDIKIISIPSQLRHDIDARKNAINSADIVFLCLPDDASREAVKLCENPKTVIIDTSTAHRTDDNWTYGFAEVRNLRKKIKSSKRIANPGCHASGFISIVSPLIENKIIKKTAKLSCFSLTGYSGGGKKMIAQYEDELRSNLLDSARVYSLVQTHKHLPEMQKICQLKNPCVFSPIVDDFYSGMLVSVPLFTSELSCSVEELKDMYRSYYKSGLVRYEDSVGEDGFISSCALSGRDDMIITVQGNNDRIVIYSLFDNLGKGASGAAIQNMNIVLKVDEKEGLVCQD